MWPCCRLIGQSVAKKNNTKTGGFLILNAIFVKYYGVVEFTPPLYGFVML